VLSSIAWVFTFSPQSLPSHLDSLISPSWKKVDCVEKQKLKSKLIMSPVMRNIFKSKIVVKYYLGQKEAPDNALGGREPGACRRLAMKS
jgi:hypothetical protein